RSPACSAGPGPPGPAANTRANCSANASRRALRASVAAAAVGLVAVAVERERVILEGEAPRGGDLALQALDVGVEEFLDPAAAQADQVVVVVPLVEFEHRLAGLEVAALEQACLLELGQDPVDRRQADLVVLGEQFLEDVLGTHVALAAGMEDFENLQARQ